MEPSHWMSQPWTGLAKSRSAPGKLAWENQLSQTRLRTQLVLLMMMMENAVGAEQHHPTVTHMCRHSHTQSCWAQLHAINTQPAQPARPWVFHNTHTPRLICGRTLLLSQVNAPTEARVQNTHAPKQYRKVRRCQKMIKRGRLQSFSGTRKHICETQQNPALPPACRCMLRVSPSIRGDAAAAAQERRPWCGRRQSISRTAHAHNPSAPTSAGCSTRAQPGGGTGRGPLSKGQMHAASKSKQCMRLAECLRLIHANVIWN